MAKTTFAGGNGGFDPENIVKIIMLTAAVVTGLKAAVTLAKMITR